MRAALKMVQRRRGAVLALAMLNLVFALLATAPLSPPLSEALDERPAASTVADGADDGPRVELLTDHPEIPSIAVQSAVVALVFWGALSWIFAGGLLSDEKFAVGCARHAGRMMKLGAMGLPLRILGGLGPLVAWPIIDTAHSFGGVLAGSLLGLFIAGLFWSLVTVTLDRARGVALSHPELTTWQVLRRGLVLSRTHMGNTLSLALFSGLGFLVVTALQVALTRSLPPASWASLVAPTAAVFGALGRAAVSSLTLFAAQ